MINEELLAMLRCPMSAGQSPLRLEGTHLVCTCCGTKFAIEDDIPNMLIEEAELPPGCATPDDLPCAKARAKTS
jgi:uncharacterized protein YbaR (Trm112 family)